MDAPIPPAVVAGARVVVEPRWSPDGASLAWLESFDGRTDLIVAPAGGGARVVVTSHVAVGSAPARGGAGFAWAGSRELVVAAEDGTLVVLAVTGGPTRRVLSYEGRAFGPVVSTRGIVAFSREDDDACDVALAPLDGSEPPRPVSDADFAWDPAWSPDGAMVAWHEWDLPNMPWDGSRIALSEVDRESRRSERAVVVAGGDREAVGQPRFAPDGSSLAFTTDRSGFVNVWLASANGSHQRPLLPEHHEQAEPTWSPGQRSYAWSPDSAEIAVCRNEAGFGRLVRASVEPSSRRAVAVGRAWHRGIDWSPAGIAAVRSGARTPDAVVVYATGGGRTTIARGPQEGFEVESLLEPEVVRWQSDAVSIHGLLTMPCRPQQSGAPPLLVDVHGGPTGQALAEWRARVAFWTSRGWAVLRPNPRGSTGSGRRFVEALAGGWGSCDVADVAAGIRHVCSEGRADPKRVAIVGSSSGGMVAMLVCLRHPELVRAGVSVSGVADLFALAESTHRFESGYVDRLVGKLPASAEQYRDRSVVTHAGQLSVPLLVLHGADDEVVPVSQTDALVLGARSAGIDIEYKVYEAEGHGLRRADNVRDELERTEAFLADRVLARQAEEARD